jgi:hypothetical protein
MVPTPSRKNEQADRKRHRDHFVWQERVAAAADLSPTLRLLALRLALHLNLKSGRCFVGHDTLAKGIGIERRSAMRLVAELERRGWLQVDRGGGRQKANGYRFIIPAETVTGESPFRGRETVTGHARPATPKNGDRGVTPIRR